MPEDEAAPAGLEEQGDEAAEEAQETPRLDLDPILDCLLADTPAGSEAAWPAAEGVLEEVFTPETWGIGHGVNTYGNGAHANLYNVESQRDFRTWLEDQGVSVEDYAEAVGPVQYVGIQVYLQALFPRARSNKGWRIRLLGFPALGVVALGLASHYQGTQNQNQMGRASALLHTQASEQLPTGLRPVLERYPAATATEWEERGLMPEPVLAIGSLDISAFDGGRGAKLRMVRNTTVKKEMATFFALKGMSAELFREDGQEALEDLRSLAETLGTERP